MTDRCGDCRHWKQDDHQRKTPMGYCTAHPPYAIFCGMVPLPPSAIQTAGPQAPKMQPIVNGCFPPTAVDQSCGEFSPKRTN